MAAMVQGAGHECVDWWRGLDLTNGKLRAIRDTFAATHTIILNKATKAIKRPRTAA